MTAHGTVAGYRAHLEDGTPTCAACRRAHADGRADYRRRRYLNHAPLSVDATGTRRRIRALCAIGWAFAEQSRRMGYHESTAFRITTRSWVTPAVAAKVRALYDELSMTPGPSARARLRAKREGWPPPLAYDDETIDDPSVQPSPLVREPAVDEVTVTRAMRGYPTHLTRTERAEAVRRLTAQGMSAVQIGERLRITARSVARLRGAA